MYAEIGNAAALDAREQDGRKNYFAVDGNRTTTVRVPEGVGVSEAFQSIIDALQHHIQPGHQPVWVESDNNALRDLLLDHFKIRSEDNVRPLEWGKETP